MIIDKLGKTLYLQPSDLHYGFTCPVCNKYFRPNLTGPASSPTISKILQHFPSDHILGGMAPYFHDTAYLLCPEGWAVFYSDFDECWTAIDKESADDGYKGIMIHQTKKGLKPLRWWWRKKAIIQFEFVENFGDSAYQHKH